MGVLYIGNIRVEKKLEALGFYPDEYFTNEAIKEIMSEQNKRIISGNLLDKVITNSVQTAAISNRLDRLKKSKWMRFISSSFVDENFQITESQDTFALLRAVFQIQKQNQHSFLALVVMGFTSSKNQEAIQTQIMNDKLQGTLIDL